ncbi:MAG: choice-of-anchor L domain-containing protein, partial [Bacteroidia bacterium]|nr:choice-of-anchor L domain-containing protein [Bacteroidia bacterium]MDW8334441.1 choice-of-anchor L domain-containing protein [Bacteroidia bacterium]
MIPCSTYTLQLMIADAGDAIYDSAVLLEANSFEFTGGSSSVASLLNLFNGQPITYESCDNDIRFTFRRSSAAANAATQNDTVFFEHLGAATHLQDYTLQPPYAVFAPGQTETHVFLVPIYDGIDEPDETVILRFVVPGTCGEIAQLQATIRNVNYRLQVNPPNDTTICAPPGTVTLNLQAGVVAAPPGVTYRWTNLANGQILSTSPNYSLTVTQNISIEVRIAANVCNVPDVRDTIRVSILTPDPNNPLTVSMPDIPPICGGGAVTLSPTVTGGVGAPYTVTYYQNGVPIGTGVPFSFQPTASGNLLVEARDQCGYTVSIFRPYVVEPGSMIASNDAVVCSGNSTTLTANVQNGALGNGYNYVWRVVGTNAFVGGGSSVSVSPSQTTSYYVSSPDFPCGNDTVRVTVIQSTQIAPIPPQTVCPGQTPTFTANVTGQGNITVTWTAPAGMPFVGNPYSPTVGVTTTFTVTAQGDCGTAQTTAQLNVLPNDLSVNLVADPPGGTVCSATGVSLSALASGGTPPYSYAWTGAAGNGPNVVVNPTGNTTVVVSVSDACTTVTRSINLNAHPPLVVEPVADVNICQGQAVNLSAIISGGSGNYLVQWRRTAGNVSVGTGAAVSFTPTQSGQYSLRVTDVDCGNQEVRLFNINFIPAFSLDPIASQTICAGQTATFTAVTSGTSGVVTYEWLQMPAGTPVGPNAPTFNVSPGATTQYRLRASDACTTRTTDFTLNVLPDNLDFTISANPGASVCAGTNVAFSANIAGGTGNYTYLWTCGAQTASG